MIARVPPRPTLAKLKINSKNSSIIRDNVVSSNELAPIWSATSLHVPKAGNDPSCRLLRSVTSWKLLSSRSRSEFDRKLTAASGISWSEKNADASWFKDRHRPSTRNSSPCAGHSSSSRVNASAPRSRLGDGAVAESWFHRLRRIDALKVEYSERTSEGQFTVTRAHSRGVAPQEGHDALVDSGQEGFVHAS